MVRQPAVEHTYNCEAQASVIHLIVQEGLKQNPKTTFVLTGDFNDYDFSTTAQILRVVNQPTYGQHDGTSLFLFLPWKQSSF